ncbi:MAG: response regulator [Acidobacteriota bacterium]
MSAKPLAEILEGFRRDFVTGAAGRLTEMEAEIERAAAGEAGDPVRRLGRHFHGLSGAGGTYGFPEVSDLASRGEASCGAVMSAGGPPPASRRAEWRGLVASIREALDGVGERMAVAIPVRREAAGADILIVEDDREVLKLLGRLSTREGFSPRIAASLAEARQQLDERLPDAVLVDVGLPDGRGFALIEEIRARPDGDAVAILVMSGGGGFANRVEAIHSGADGYFRKPIDSEALHRRLRYLLDRERAEPRRILSVEDDPDQAAFLRAVLESAGYVVQVCSDPFAFESDLATFRPDLVLMDSELPGSSGLALARYLRQEERYATLPVIFLTAGAETSLRIAALRSGADEHLSKPVAPGLLLSTVAARLERAQLLQSLLRRDGLTRLLTHTAFLEEVNRSASRLAAASHEPAALVVLDVDGFRAINDSYGHPAGDRVLASLGSLLQRRIRHSDTMGRLGADEIGILLDDLPEVEAVALMERIAAEFRDLVQAAGEGVSFRSSFSAGVAPFASGDAGAWLRAAQSALAESKTGGGDRVRPFRRTPAPKP